MSEEERARVRQAQQADTDRIFTLPNMLSFLRLALIPLIVYFYDSGNFWAAFAMLALSGITDVFDGWIARTFHLVSDFGKALDPAADKLTQVAVLLCLLPPRYWWVVGVLMFKEVSIGILTLVALRRTHKIYSAGWYGKLCTGVIYLSMAVLILWAVVSDKPVNPLFLTIDAIVISALVLLSLIKYAIYFGRILKDARVSETRETP